MLFIRKRKDYRNYKQKRSVHSWVDNTCQLFAGFLLIGKICFLFSIIWSISWSDNLSNYIMLLHSSNIYPDGIILWRMFSLSRFQVFFITTAFSIKWFIIFNDSDYSFNYVTAISVLIFKIFPVWIQKH